MMISQGEAKTDWKTEDDGELSELSAIDYEELEVMQKEYEEKQTVIKLNSCCKHHKKVATLKEL